MEWKTIISMKTLSKDDIKSVMKKCSDIHEKDDSFVFKLKDDTLIVFSPDRNKANRRGAWLTNKVSELLSLSWEVSR